MARFNDQGAYAIGNVKICPIEENHAEAKCVGSPGEKNGGYGKNYWAADTPTNAARRIKVSKQFAGKPKSLAQRAQMSATATGRRRVVRDGKLAWAHAGDVDFPRS